MIQPAHASDAVLTTLADLTRMRPFLVLAPHPDDESLGCGGLIAQAARAGITAGVVVLTDGSRSHVARGWPPARLAALRAMEVKDAVSALGLPADRLFLMEAEDGTLEASDSMVTRVSAIARQIGAETLFVTDPADSHPDHRAAFRIAVQLVADTVVRGLVTYPVGQCFEGGNLDRFEQLNIAPSLSAKRAAVGAHRSQMDAVMVPGSGFRLTSAALGTFLATVERFRPVHGLPGCLPPETPAHFDALFAQSPDPWRYDYSAYEADRHAATIPALGGRRFGRAWEAGAANGALTAKLLPFCDALVSTDASREALARAEKRVGTRAELALMQLPHQAPEGPFDLILMSDMLYYLGLDGVIATARLCAERLEPGGLLVVVSWLGDTRAALTGEESAEAFLAMASGMELVIRQREPGYRLDVLRMRG